MDLCFDVAIICIFVGIVSGEQTTDWTFTRQSHDPPLVVKEGIKVTLLCQKSSNTVFINFASIHAREEDLDVTVIDSSNMSDISNKYGFNETDDGMYAFTIYNVTRDDEGTYRCIQGLGRDVRTRVLEIIYSPSDDSPQCSSNYKFPVIYYDEIKDDFEFNCSTERGKPPVLSKIYVNNEEPFTLDLEIITETRRDKKFTTYSLSQKFNATLQDSVFVCNVTQQLPYPYRPYEGSCSFGPLHFLSGFSLSLSNITSEGDNQTLTCTSNLTGVEIKWIINIPSDRYIVTNFNQSITILSSQPETSGVINVVCQGSYGSRINTANTTLFLLEEANDEKNLLPVLLVTFTVSAFISAFSVLVFVICRRKRKTKNVTELQKPSTSFLYRKADAHFHKRNQCEQ